MTKSIALLALLLLSWSCLAEQQNWYFIRHFEKQQGADPHLTVQGRQQAQTLVTALKGKVVNKIYSTQYHRTLESVAPLATERGIEVALYDPSKLAEFAQQIRRENNILIVGHSNTTPQLIRLLGSQTADLSETDYGQLFTLTISDNQSKLSIQTLDKK